MKSLSRHPKKTKIKKLRASSLWKITYDQFESSEEGVRETLCTLGNGYFATRGAIPEALASKIHYPGTYISGLYNKLDTHVGGKTITNEDMVNCPNWIFFTFKIGDGDWFYPSSTGIISYYQELDMHKGILYRKMRFENHKGQRTLIETSRIVHIADPHYGLIKYSITPENYSDWIRVRTMLDGAVVNAGVERYKQLNSKHWEPHSAGVFGKKGVFLVTKTSQSKIIVAEAAKIRIFTDDKEINPHIKCITKGKERIGQEFRLLAKKKQRYEIEKSVAIYTSRDEGVSNPAKAAINSAQKLRRFKRVLVSHQNAWDMLWRRFDVQIDGDDFSQKVLRLHMFHILQTASVHNTKIDAGFPARGLHGEAYRGHIFWDEIFAMSLFDLHIPDISKALIHYRYRRLSQARIAAEKSGYRGAMFPWQSGSTGEEETQVMHLNPISGTWGPDHSHLQRHVSLAIAYNVWQSYKRVGNLDFMLNYGAEILLSIAQFVVSLVKYNPADGRYHTHGLMGPDEFHEILPGTSEPGLKDNAYTNIMIVWLLLKIEELLAILPGGYKVQILKKLKITHIELNRWDDIAHKMNLVINNDGIIAHFDGYFELKELDWDGYKAKYDNIQRLDRILKAEGESPDEYKVSKQADLLMLFYLFPIREMEDIFARLGYILNEDVLRKNFDYYLKRTSHGSTLSKIVYCFVSQLLGGAKDSWKWFMEVLESDIYDVQGGTTPEGIHAGVMAASVDIVRRGFGGVSMMEDIIRINPNLPSHWNRIKMRLHYKGRWVSLSITKKQVTILVQGPMTRSFVVPVEINKKIYSVPLGKTCKFSLKKK